MFKYFKSKRWSLWAWPGAVVIALVILLQVIIEVRINDWFGLFYGQIESSLKEPNSIPLSDFLGTLGKFGVLAGMWVVLGTGAKYLSSHWTFRWRTSMVERYHKTFGNKPIEGASQRVQEDTLKFARLVEDLGANFVEAVITLVMFFPILLVLGKNIEVLPFVGHVPYPLVWVATLTALGGTVLLVLVGKKLPGLEYNIQKEEAAYRKELVRQEDLPREPHVGQYELFNKDMMYEAVKSVHYRSYFHYLYFNMVRWSYIQGMVVVPYVAMAPSIVAGLISLGLVRQIGHAFNQVAGNLQYLVRSWPQVVELMSVYKRLSEYERG